MRATASPAGESGYRVTKTIPVGGDEGWDYVTVDSAARRVYVSHGSHVVVLRRRLRSGCGRCPRHAGCPWNRHRCRSWPWLHQQWPRQHSDNFDLKTLKTIGIVKTGTNPDAIIYDPRTKRVFVLNGRSKDATAINAADGTVAGTLALGGKPEFAVVDGKGSIFVNIEDSAEVVQFDPQKLTIIRRWHIAPCEGTFRLGYGPQNSPFVRGLW